MNDDLHQERVAGAYADGLAKRVEPLPKRVATQGRQAPIVQVYDASDDWERSHVDEEPPPPDWRWRLRAANGEIVASGEGHATEADARRAFRDTVNTVLKAVGFRLEHGEWPE